MNRYLIPRRITQRWELMPGWGWRELGATGIGFAIGAALFALAALLRLPLAVHFLLLLAPTGCAAYMAMPMALGGSFLDMVLAWRAYARTRHLYLYDLGRDDT